MAAKGKTGIELYQNCKEKKNCSLWQCIANSKIKIKIKPSGAKLLLKIL